MSAHRHGRTVRLPVTLFSVGACLGTAALTGCPLDERTLYAVPVVVIGSSGEGGVGGDEGSGGDSGADTGGSAADGGSSAGEAGTAGNAGRGSAGETGGGGKAGSSSTAGKGGNTSGAGGDSAGSGTSGSAGTGVVERCPDIDGNQVLDCDETIAANAEFDEDAKNWLSETGVEASWEEDDAHEKDDSGSLAVENQKQSDLSGVTMLGARQCFATTGGTIYHFAAEIAVLGDDAATQGGFQLLVYDQPACSGNILHSLSSNLLSGEGWRVAELTYLTPTTGKSIAMRLVTLKPFREPPARVLFDNILVRSD